MFSGSCLDHIVPNGDWENRVGMGIGVGRKKENGIKSREAANRERKELFLAWICSPYPSTLFALCCAERMFHDFSQ